MNRLLLGVPLWPHWIMFVISILMTIGYGVLYIGETAAAYQKVILVFWIAVSIIFLARIVQSHKEQKAKA